MTTLPFWRHVCCNRYSMDYLNTIQCKKEPFAANTGEDIFLSQPIRDSFEKLTHSIRLGAGLHIVIGDDGSGKTTLIRQLSDKFSGDKNTIVLCINNPQFSNLQQFLTTLAGAFKTIKPPSSVGDKKLQQAFNSFFLKNCQQAKKNILLLIDNGHMLPEFCFQALAALYDSHTDCRRLLQTVICGETSLQKNIKSSDSLNSRIVFSVSLKPFSFKETKEFIRFHLEHAAANPDSPPALFSSASQWAIYRLTQGDPQKITDLCHLIVLTLGIENRKKADWFMALRCAKLLNPKRAKKLQLIRAGSLSSLFILMLVFGLWSEQISTFTAPKMRPPTKPPVAQKAPAPKTQPQPPAENAVNPPSPAEEQSVAVVTPPGEVAVIVEEAAPKIPAEIEVKPAPPAEEQSVAEVTPPGEVAVIVEEAAPKLPVEIIVKPAPPAEEQSVAVVTPPEEVAVIAEIITPAIKERRDVMAGDTFLVMIQKVYGPGHLKPHFIEQVIAANPQLKDPDNLIVGDEVFFPVLSKETTKTFRAAKKQAPLVARKAESLVAKKLDRSLQPLDAPDLIGKLSVMPGDTLGRLIRGIYGPFSFNPDYTAKVLAVNTHLKNPNRLEVGDTIYFPDLPITPEIGLPARPTQVAGRQNLPDFLGEIIAVEDETFSDMMRKIYGPSNFNEENVKKVLAVNPGLKNTNRLSVGQKIRFPTILAELPPAAADAWWVKIITLDNLQSAYRYMRIYSKWTPQMLIIPLRNDEGKILFNILLDSNFADIESAQTAINGLPASITADARPLHGLNPNTFYYWTTLKE